jgi:hypothetical protein
MIFQETTCRDEPQNTRVNEYMRFKIKFPDEHDENPSPDRDDRKSRSSQRSGSPEPSTHTDEPRAENVSSFFHDLPDPPNLSEQEL